MVGDIINLLNKYCRYMWNILYVAPKVTYFYENRHTSSIIINKYDTCCCTQYILVVHDMC